LNAKKNKKFWEEVIAYFPLMRHGTHRKRRIQQFLYCCVCICRRSNVFTEPLPSNDRRDNTWYGMVSTGAGFPLHLDLDVVYCTSRVNFQLSRHTLSAPAQCTAYLPKNSGIQLSPLSASNVDSATLAPPTREQWYLTYSPFRYKVDIALCQLHLPENSGT
jgi:hypothetical protein